MVTLHKLVLHTSGRKAAALLIWQGKCDGSLLSIFWGKGRDGLAIHLQKVRSPMLLDRELSASEYSCPSKVYRHC